MHIIQTSNRIIKGINTPVITCDGFDIDQIEDREKMLRENVEKMQERLDEFAQMKDMIMHEWQCKIESKGF